MNIKSLFPHSIEVTEDHRELAIKRGGLHYLGNVLLETFIPEELHKNIFWGLSIGNIGPVTIKTEEKIEDGYIPLYLGKTFTGNNVKFELR